MTGKKFGIAKRGILCYTNFSFANQPLEEGITMRTKDSPRAKRLITLAFLLCFVMAALISEAFILTHANHEHDHLGIGGECIVCAHIHSIENLVKQLGVAAGGLSTAWLGLFAAITLLFCVSAFWLSSPILLKTRLNN